MAVPTLWAAVIFFVYSIPGGDLIYEDIWSFFRFDKFVHVGVFALWVVMLIIAFKKQGTNRYLKNNARIVAFFIALAYGGLLEYFQSKWFLERATDPFDFIANMVGAFVGLALFRMVYGKCSAY